MAGNHRHHHVLLLLVSAAAISYTSPFVSAAGEAVDTFESVPDLKRAMYRNVDGYPCVRLLNLTGEIGCSNPGRGKVISPIVKLKSFNSSLDRPSAVLIELDQMEDFFLRVSSDLSYAKKVAGVLVEWAGTRNDLTGFSPDHKSPQAEFAPYKNVNYPWNPIGSGIMWNSYNFPVFLLTENSTKFIQEIANSNTKGADEYPVEVAEFDLVMKVMTAETHDSESCLKQQTCLPLGGYSVWSSLPPINNSSTKPPKPIILAVASQDSQSFFRDINPGSDSLMSGLISLLAAVDALAHLEGVNGLKKQLVFLFLTGEAWGYLGSRRFLAELEASSDDVRGLNGTLIEQVLEIGSVGKGSKETETSFFAHTGGDTSGVNKMMTAIQQASVSFQPEKVSINLADGENPGLPPSSLIALLRKNSSLSGVVLEEFDSAFANKFYHSHLDGPSNINVTSIVKAASLVARTLYILASDDVESKSEKLDAITVNASLVQELVDCLLSCDPGLSCGLVRQFISPSTICPNHYVGVLPGAPSDYRYADDTPRFIWNFMADRTSVPNHNATSCSQGCKNAGEVCVSAEVDKGTCKVSTTRFVPAYSTRLNFVDGAWRLQPANASDLMGMIDPVWTESYWDTIGLRAYKIQSSFYDNIVLLWGIAVTVFTHLLIVVSRASLMKAMKRD